MEYRVKVKEEGGQGGGLCLSLRFVLLEEEAADCLYSIVW